MDSCQRRGKYGEVEASQFSLVATNKQTVESDVANTPPSKHGSLLQMSTHQKHCHATQVPWPALNSNVQAFSITTKFC